jgi:hypothetical protein
LAKSASASLPNVNGNHRSRTVMSNKRRLQKFKGVPAATFNLH